LKTSSLQEEINLEKKDGVKKTAGKTEKTSKPARAVKAKSDEIKIAIKTLKKRTEPQTKTEAAFILEAPQAEQVCVAGSFNEWDPTANVLGYDEDGRWGCTLALEPGEYEYRFIVDGEWCDDPGNGMRRPNGFGTENCILIV
jgi:1,4-alpha-glucan branching enzyme